MGPRYTHDKLITRLPLGFWTYQFATKEYAASGSTLLEVFPNRPFGTKQKTVFQHLQKINDTRNRIAHYEPVCFDKATGCISTTYIGKRYKLIIELLKWLGYQPKNILYGINGVQHAIVNIQKIGTANLSEINSLPKTPV